MGIIFNFAKRTQLAISFPGPLLIIIIMINIVLLDVLVCSIAEYFYELYCILRSSLGRVKIQTTNRNTQRYSVHTKTSNKVFIIRLFFFCTKLFSK